MTQSMKAGFLRDDTTGALAIGASQYDRDYGWRGVIAPSACEASTPTITMVANTAFFSRFVVSRPMPIITLAYVVTTAAGSDDAVDVGLFTVVAGNLSRIVSLGPTTGQLNTTGRKALTVGSTQLTPGTVYYAGLSCGVIGTTAAVIAGGGLNSANVNRLMGSSVGDTVCVTLGGSHPLPASVVAPTVAINGPKMGVLEV